MVGSQRFDGMFERERRRLIQLRILNCKVAFSSLRDEVWRPRWPLPDFHEKDGHRTRPGFQRAAQAENPTEQISYVVSDNADSMRGDGNGNNTQTVGAG